MKLKKNRVEKNIREKDRSQSGLSFHSHETRITV
jgi:hypothetical protein